MVNQQDIFINRELSWLEFDKRVLALANDESVPLGEQLKFASIYASNLDEFFMVRVGSLYDRTLLHKNDEEKENKTQMTPQQQLDAIMPKVKKMQNKCDKSVDLLLDRLDAKGYKRICFDELGKEQLGVWKKYFENEIFPVLSPQVIDKRHPFPFLRGNEVYVGAILGHKPIEKPTFGLIPVSARFGRVIFVQNDDTVSYVLTEDIVHHFANLVFGKKAVQGKCLFRVTRNADITVEEGMFDHDVDYRTIMGELLKKRRKLAAVRLQTSIGAPVEITDFLCEKLMLPNEQVFEQSSPMDLSIGFKLASRLSADKKDRLFYTPRRPMLPRKGFELSQVVQKNDVLVQYPFQSIRPFLNMLVQAAYDPDVISIKMTLYRVASESKIIQALCAAAENGKEVVAIVELRARFDEQNNIDFSKVLEESGATVIYGFEEYKVHSKLCLITKRKGNRLSYISQIGTGNYNEKTSEQYTDLSFITANNMIGTELAGIFNDLALENITKKTEKMLIAPLNFKSVLMSEMDAEIKARSEGKVASIVIKCNSISDREIIQKISESSCVGVPVNMIVRGICCVKAGVPGLTDNVKVRSIVGRYLEHSRVYCFGKGDNLRMYIASGDFLTRNTQRRVEAGVRITDPALVAQLKDVINLQLADNVNAHEMNPDGTYSKVKPHKGDVLIDSQNEMYSILANAWEIAEQQKSTVPDKKLGLISKLLGIIKGNK